MPGEAPSDLELVVEFANTHDLESGHDELGDPKALETWLAERGLVAHGEAVRAIQWRFALKTREALRSLALANTCGDVDAEALAALDEAARRARLRVRFGTRPASLEVGAGGVEGAVGRLLAAVHAAQVSGDWDRVKACSKASCRWLFYDRSRNRSGKWCAMAVCGNRVKARRYRHRRQASGAASE